jgi:predicted HTH transcriptional regulator|tara:strand:- start:160 stop:552 length:393 start_codon:yes stop_codon:yes gene_type:complete
LLILAKSVTLNNAIQKGVNIMFKSLFANDSLRVVAKAKKTETRGRKTLSKRQKVLNLLSKGESVTWKTLRNRFDLVSPRALVDTLRAEGNMIYVNQTAKGTSYRMGVPTKAIIAAGIKKLYGTPFAYKNA